MRAELPLKAFAAALLAVVAVTSADAAANPPSGRGAKLLPATYLKTVGSQITDLNGNPVRIAAVGWAGTDNRPGFPLDGVWKVGYNQILDSIKADGFNAVRIPWIDAGLNTPILGIAPNGNLGVDYTKGRNQDLYNKTMLQTFQVIVAYAGQIGLKIIFDHHSNEGWKSSNWNGLWFDLEPGYINSDGAYANDGTTTEAAFIANWILIARTFAGNSTVIGFDIDNEPNGMGVGFGYANISWGVGNAVNGHRVNDIWAMYQNVGAQIQAVNPDALIICEGPGGYTSAPPAGYGFNASIVAPEGDFTGVVASPGVAAHPISLGVANRVVYSVHEYPMEINGLPDDYGLNLINRMNNSWGFIVKQNIAPVYLGEIGSSMLSIDAQGWSGTLLSYLNGKQGANGGVTFSGAQQPISATWWAVGPSGGNPDGLQSDWGVSYYRPEVQKITDQILFKGPIESSPSGTYEDWGTGSVVDSLGNLWSMVGGQVTVNGIVDATTSNIWKLAYVGGKIWNMDSTFAWQYKTTPTSPWLPTTRTATFPIPISASGSVSLAGGASLVDANKNDWFILNGQVYANGALDNSTANVGELIYSGGRIWQSVAQTGGGNLWRSKALKTDPWTPTGGTTVGPLPTSANKAAVFAAGQPIVDAGGNVWTIINGQIAANGQIDDGWTWNVVELTYFNGQVWQKNSANLWWSAASPSATWQPPGGTSVPPY